MVLGGSVRWLDEHNFWPNHDNHRIQVNFKDSGELCAVPRLAIEKYFI